jgi:TonB-linked SusC/RagA family outer membrane protein
MLILTFLLGFSTTVFSQSTTSLKGKVVDERTNEPIVGAVVKVKGSASGVATDLDGNYQVDVNQALPVTLVITFLGYKYQEIDVYENTPLTVTLAEDLNKIGSVVVVGYGTQKREDITGAIASIQVTQLKEATPTSFVDGLQGLASGVQVTSTSGAPGATSIVRIRGGNSITGGNDPLYVIDGFPVYNDNSAADAGALFGAAAVTPGTSNGFNPLSSINPGDIESIEVLKDASATAIYGSRGANGVVIITTKKGKKGDARVTYDGSYGFQTISHKIDLLNAQQWATYYNDAQGKTVFSPAQINAFANNSTDWQNQVFRNAPTQNHQVSISGGNDKTQYSTSLGYLDQQGIVLNTDLKRYTGRINLISKVSKDFNVGVNLNESYSSSDLASSSEITNILSMPPVIKVRDSTGAYTSYNTYSTGTGNPVAYLNSTINQSIIQRSLGSAFGEYEIIKDLKAKVLIGTDLLNNNQFSYIPLTIYEGNATIGTAAIGTKHTTNLLNENTLSYSKIINENHNIDLLGGYTQQTSETKGSIINATGFVNDIQTYNNLASATNRTVSSSYSNWTLQSYLGRVNYNYAHKYFLTASLRSDGSSRLGLDHLWGLFPSGSIGWQADKEAFLYDIDKAIKLNHSKIRISYGRTGNSEIPPYQSLALLTSMVYPNGSGSTNTGFAPYQLANPNLKWETTDQYDAGIDLGFFDNRIKFIGDVYYKRTHDLLISNYIPETSGYMASLQNVGEVENKGFELGLNTENVKGKFSWNTNVTYTVNRNKVLSLGNGVDQIIIGGGTQSGSLIEVGQPLGTFYGLKTDGLYTAATLPKDLSTTLLGASTKVGDVKYVDINGDGKITTAGDQTKIGSPQPKFIFGFVNNFSYANFDLSIFIQGSYGNQIYSYLLRQLQIPNGAQNAIEGFSNHYTSTNTSGKYEVPNLAINNNSNSDLYVYDGSYLRLKSVTLGYTLPKAVLSKIKINKVRLYISGQNLFTLTKYPGFDPDVNSYSGNASRQGVDLGAYPSARTVIGGLNVTF